MMTARCGAIIDSRCWLPRLYLITSPPPAALFAQQHSWLPFCMLCASHTVTAAVVFFLRSPDVQADTELLPVAPFMSIPAAPGCPCKLNTGGVKVDVAGGLQRVLAQHHVVCPAAQANQFYLPLYKSMH